jgi:hypothetical protein
MKKPKPITQALNPDLRGSWPALQRAARRARELAIQTGTAIVVSRDGAIELIYPQRDATGPQAQEQTAPYGDQP